MNPFHILIWEFPSLFSPLECMSVSKILFATELEPEHLREETRCVLNSTQKLAFNNYMTFIQTAECTKEVFKDVSHVTVT